jgi:hypothetical protein
MSSRQGEESGRYRRKEEEVVSQLADGRIQMDQTRDRRKKE